MTSKELDKSLEKGLRGEVLKAESGSYYLAEGKDDIGLKVHPLDNYTGFIPDDLYLPAESKWIIATEEFKRRYPEKFKKALKKYGLENEE